MFISASAALSQTLALLATFLGLGVIVTVVVVYVLAQVFAERRENQERREGV